MTFKESINTCLREKYATFSGRASRSEYWYFVLFLFLVLAGFVIIGGIFTAILPGDFEDALSSIPVLILAGIIGLFWLGTVIPSISAVVRRFHDYNLSGWWYLLLVVLSMIPVVGWIASIATLVICVLKGTAGPNKFGADPLGQNDAEVFE